MNIITFSALLLPFIMIYEPLLQKLSDYYAPSFELYLRIVCLLVINIGWDCATAINHSISIIDVITIFRFGRYTQGVTTEHLAHVIFGHYGLDMEYPDQKRICENFLHVSQCPGSPCTTLFNTNG